MAKRGLDGQTKGLASYGKMMTGCSDIEIVAMAILEKLKRRDKEKRVQREREEREGGANDL